MAQYQDILVRNSLTDQGIIPRTGAMSHSPDIIPYGQEPVVDPQKFFSGNYDQDVGKDLVAGAQNYLYLRGKNLGTDASSGEAYLYYAKSSLLLYPDQWESNQLKTSAGKDSVPVSADAGKIAVTNDPFTWQPDVPGAGWHYCLIGRVATKKNPNPIPGTGDIQSFAAWVAQNGGIGWRNVAVVSAGAPTWTNEIQYDQGPKEDNVKFFVTCTNVPLGTYVSFSSGTPNPGGIPISLPKTEVTQNPSFIVGMQTKVAAGYSTKISYSYWSEGHAPPKGFKITLSAAIVVPPSNTALYNLAYEPGALGFDKVLDYTPEGELVEADRGGIGPSRMIILGDQVALPNAP